LFVVLSALVVVSMICGTIVIFLPDPQRRAQPTAPPAVPTATPLEATASPSPVVATPTATLAVAPSPLPRPTS